MRRKNHYTRMPLSRCHNLHLQSLFLSIPQGSWFDLGQRPTSTYSQLWCFSIRHHHLVLQLSFFNSLSETVSSLITVSTTGKYLYHALQREGKSPHKNANPPDAAAFLNKAFLFLSFPQELICLRTKANLYIFAVVVFHYQSPPPYLEIFFL